MKIEKIFILISMMLIFTGCSQSNPTIKNENTTPLPSSSPKSNAIDTPNPVISYINDRQYNDSIQKYLIKIINENTMAINDRNKIKFLLTFTKNTSEDTKHLESLYTYMVDNENEIITKMDNIEFNPAANGSGEYSVTLLRTLYLKNTKETKVQSSSFYFKEKNNEWQLFAID
ncbi:hypothetical protein [Paenibacillus sp. GP183]|uniref:hypothetical protein n=1 Tax=Paenibacillus sp. GP183 TaxID=1882751 RepID=UPI000B846EA3|nr:hypothetical protein [Paenibacillus sp. GP183]